MSRPLRIEYWGAVYHLMNRGSARQKVFLSRADYGESLKTVSQAHDQSGVQDLVRSRRGEENEGRKVGMYLMKRLSDMTLVEVAREYGMRSYGAAAGRAMGFT